MKAIVKSHPETNQVITEATSENGTNYGKFRVEQTSLEPGKGGALNIRTRSAFITVFGEKDINFMKSLLKDGMEYPVAGRIQRIESREPQYEGQLAKVKPNDDGTTSEYLLDGAPVYFTDEWNADANCQDVLLRAAVEQAEEVSAEAAH